MTELVFFLLGIITFRYCFPIIDNIVTWFATWVEYKITKITSKTCELENNSSSPTRQIGFVIDSPDEEE